MTVKVDGSMLGTGHVLLMVGLKFRKLLTVFFKPDCMNELPRPSFYQLRVVAVRPGAWLP